MNIKHMITHRTTLILLFLINPLIHCSQKGLVIVPLADLISEPIKQSFPTMTPQQAYDQLPLSGGNTNPYHSCLRTHQLLFHETVIILEERKDEVRIEIPHFFYITRDTHEPQHSYWTLKKNILPFKELEKNNIDLTKIPQSPSFKNKIVEDEKSITLTMPYADQITGQTFSAGTRFVKVENKSADTKTKKEEAEIKKTKNKKTVSVYAFDAKDITFKQIEIPSEIILQPQKSRAQKIKQFVNLVRSWAQTANGFIPYVWGGSSFIDTSNGAYIETKLTIKKRDCSYYNLSDYQKSPKSGMDCTGIIGRAAQMCGIPYFFKNSLTVATFLKPLQTTQQLQEGDIIWIPGHVMIVSDLKKNTLLEARSSVYGGQGKIQEISLDKVFKKIKNYEQLIHSYHKKEKIQRLSESDKIVQTFADLKLLKLASVWD